MEKSHQGWYLALELKTQHSDHTHITAYRQSHFLANKLQKERKARKRRIVAIVGPFQTSTEYAAFRMTWRRGCRGLTTHIAKLDVMCREYAESMKLRGYVEYDLFRFEDISNEEVPG